mmetsp:Transcript_16869/g.47345  ORF Transcript_16869/g.47345 Transcript_16869/m.47345 type:complete len:236 (+) Transcript_16869:1829-2536(+)
MLGLDDAAVVVAVAIVHVEDGALFQGGQQGRHLHAALADRIQPSQLNGRSQILQLCAPVGLRRARADTGRREGRPVESIHLPDVDAGVVVVVVPLLVGKVSNTISVSRIAAAAIQQQIHGIVGQVQFVKALILEVQIQELCCVQVFHGRRNALPKAHQGIVGIAVDRGVVCDLLVHVHFVGAAGNGDVMCWPRTADGVVLRLPLDGLCSNLDGATPADACACACTDATNNEQRMM